MYEWRSSWFIDDRGHAWPAPVITKLAIEGALRAGAAERRAYERTLKRSPRR